MRKPFLLALIILLSIINNASAQGRRAPIREAGDCPTIYLGLGTGLNYSTGLIGLNIEVPVFKGLSLGAGAGLSSWGNKFFGEVRYSFSPCNRGWALGTGVTYNTGLQDLVTELPTTYGTRSVMLELNPKLNAFICGYRIWTVGKSARNRFHLQLGYSIPLSNDDYTVRSGDILTSDGVAVMNVLSPGGLIFGIGFSFGIGGR